VILQTFMSGDSGAPLRPVASGEAWALATERIFFLWHACRELPGISD